MHDNGRWDKDGGAGWEVDNEPQVPEDDLSTQKEVKFTKGGYRAPSKGEIAGVSMRKGYRPWAKVYGGGRPGTFCQVPAE